jgi:NADPH:quinone reductase
VFAYQVQKYRDRATRRDGAVGGEPMGPEWFREDFVSLLELLRADKFTIVPQRSPFAEAGLGRLERRGTKPRSPPKACR